MFGLSACASSLIVLFVIAVLTGFGMLIVVMGYLRLLRESGKMSFWAVATSFPLFARGHFGERLEVPRRRLATIASVVFLLFAVLLLSIAARTVTC
ncbi:hypothetical protein [Prosthecomicrobium sp. N25]|uniref:hypothetical protein n=1 Tax=Prosthecomicrobium sp. N25 TaxID=3129254 RepID=UPI003076DB95